MDLEVAWSGSLEAQGLAKSLSGYQGASTLGMPDKRAVRETKPHMLHVADLAVLRRREYDHRRAAKEKHAEQRAIWRASQKAYKAEAQALMQALREAQQQTLFGEQSA